MIYILYKAFAPHRRDYDDLVFIFNKYILFAMALPTTRNIGIYNTHNESEQSSHLKLLQTVKSIRICTMHAGSRYI